MELRQLRTMLAIADYGSFAAAADAVNLTQSAISLQIKNLEDELGFELFDRRHRPPVLNESGMQLVEHARKVVKTCDEISRLGGSDRLKGSLVLGAVPTTLTGIVPIALAAMRKRHPGLHIKVKSGLSVDLVGQLRSGDIDAALVSEPMQGADGLQSRRIAFEPLAVIAPPEIDGELDSELLEAAPYIQFNKRAWAGQQIDQHLKDRRIRVRVNMEIDSLEAIARMVRHGLGVSVIPLSTRAAPLSSGLKWVAFGTPPLYRNLVLMQRHANPKAPLADALIEILLAKAGDNAA